MLLSTAQVILHLHQLVSCVGRMQGSFSRGPWGSRRASEQMHSFAMSTTVHADSASKQLWTLWNRSNMYVILMYSKSMKWFQKKRWIVIHIPMGLVYLFRNYFWNSIMHKQLLFYYTFTTDLTGHVLNKCSLWGDKVWSKPPNTEMKQPLQYSH